MNITDLQYIKSLCDEYGYPEGSFEALEAAYNAVRSNEISKSVFEDIRAGYEASAPDEYDFTSMLERVDALEEKVGVSKYTLHLLNYLLLTPKMREHYVERGIDLQIFKDSMDDFRLKLVECIRLHGIVGTHAPSWHKYFLKIELFALGRLQFHVIKSTKKGNACGVSIEEGTPVLNTHIPSSGPLKIEDCLDSFARAEKFFKGTFPEGEPTIIMCDSWLLFPEHKVMLPETSGIRRFAEMFTIIHARYAAPHQRPWVIFYGDKDLPADQLPEKTTLERVYKERYVKGMPSGSACGVIIFKDGKILNTERDKML